MSRCGHEPKVVATCVHLAAATEYCERYGGGPGYELVCPACAASGAATDVAMCRECAAAAVADRAWHAELGVIGRPPVVERDAGLAFVHERVELATRLPAAILDLAPAPGPAPAFYAFLHDGGLYRIDLGSRAVRRIADLAARHLHMARAVGLAVSPADDVAAVVNDEGGSGAVIRLADGVETVALHRGDFRPGDRFPVTLAHLAGRTVVVSATRWNRLDAFDALTGELLTARTYGMVAEGETPAHYLDFRHGLLLASPGGERLADAGDSEDGLARVASFSLARLLGEEPWESEDGPSRHEHGQRWYAPHAQLAWLDDRRLALWGYGPSDRALIDAICVCDATSGALLRWFPGPPRGELAVIGDYLAVHSTDGTEVWDPGRGERLLRDPGLTPQRFHPGAQAFVTTNPSGDLFVLSRLVARG